MADRAPIVTADFDVPSGLSTSRFILEPLGPQHNDADYAAWTSSTDHILSTPGFGEHGWPREMTPEQNLGDLQMHQTDYADRVGFTYTVLHPSSRDIIGCVYIYPPLRDGFDVDVRSWVRADHAELDLPLYESVSAWLADDWPFSAPDYAARAR